MEWIAAWLRSGDVLAKCQNFLDSILVVQKDVACCEGNKNNNVKTTFRIYSKDGLQNAPELPSCFSSPFICPFLHGPCSTWGVKSLDKLFALVSHEDFIVFPLKMKRIKNQGGELVTRNLGKEHLCAVAM